MKFRKKPVVIEAFQMTKKHRWEGDWPEWLMTAWNKNPGEVGSLFLDSHDPDYERLVIGTLEGIHRVDWNDWIIQGIKGELYPCKPDIFEATYDEVKE